MKKFLALPFVLLVAASCDLTEDVEAEIDCNAICQRYADCFDEDYDVSACQDRCEDDVDQGELTMDEVNACYDCIDDRSCAEGTLSCATECLDIVP